MARTADDTPNMDPCASGRRAEVITKSDTVNHPRGQARALYIGGVGDVAVVCLDDTVCIFSAVPVGTILPIQSKRVNSTSTTASLIVAIY